MIAGAEQRLEYDRAIGAAQVCAAVRGWREKRPNLRQLYRQLIGKKKRALTEEDKKLLARSNARVAKGKRSHG